MIPACCRSWSTSPPGAPLFTCTRRRRPASADELQRTACAVMAFGFAEVISVWQALNRIPVPVSA